MIYGYIVGVVVKSLHWLFEIDNNIIDTTFFIFLEQYYFYQKHEHQIQLDRWSYIYTNNRQP